MARLLLISLIAIFAASCLPAPRDAAAAKSTVKEVSSELDCMSDCLADDTCDACAEMCLR